MIVDEVENVQVPTVDDFVPEYLDELQEDVILDRGANTSHGGDVEYLWVGKKESILVKQNGW